MKEATTNMWARLRPLIQNNSAQILNTQLIITITTLITAVSIWLLT